jgi:hypothetical protein
MPRRPSGRGIGATGRHKAGDVAREVLAGRLDPSGLEDEHRKTALARQADHRVHALGIVERDERVEHPEQLGPLELRVRRQQDRHRPRPLHGVAECCRRDDRRPVDPRAPARRRDARVDADDGPGHALRC